jgi:flagellar biosynthetic protein FliQ
MLDSGFIIESTIRALWMSFVLCGPILLMILLVGLILGVLQAATSINETAVSFVPKLVGVALVIAALGPVTLPMFVDYLREVIQRIPELTR